MVTVSRLQAGEYSVSDGRHISKDGSDWYVLKPDGSHDFGPVTTLAAAKEYVQTGIAPLGQNNMASTHGRRQSKKEFNAYLASEAKQGNHGPIVLYFTIFLVVVLLFAVLQESH